MLLSSLVVLAAAASGASAAPLLRRSECVPSYAPDGTYIDEGCGIVLRADGGLCVRTDYDTAASAPGPAPVYLEECVAGAHGRSGGRWSVSLGATKLRNMEAASPDFCLTANADRTAVVAARCADGDPAQDWDTSLPWGDAADARIKLRGHDVCLQAAKKGKGDQLALAKCGCATDQIFDAPTITP